MAQRDIWPTFFIVGAPRAGTTSLYRYLQCHPRIFMPEVKEPHFFSRLHPCQELRHLYWPVRNEDHYLSLFRAAGCAKAVGEASPSYLVTEAAAHRIKSKVPAAKIIVLVRDPIERAFSHYLMDLREGVVSSPFYEALVNDYEASKKGWGFSRLYIEEGNYYGSVRRYLDLFGRENVLVLVFEEFVESPYETVMRVLRFLGIDEALPVTSRLGKVYNAFVLPRNWVSARLVKCKSLRLYGGWLIPTPVRLNFLRSVLFKSGQKPPLNPLAVECLRPIFRTDVLRLESLLGRRLPFATTKGEVSKV